MKTEFLKSLGIEDKETIDAIMAENGRDINKVKGNTARLEEQVTELTEKLKEQESLVKELSPLKEEKETLTKKVQDLEKEKVTFTSEYESKVAGLQKNYAIENGVRDAKAKNIKAVMALLDMDKIKFDNGQIEGLSEQLESLTKDADTSFLFGETITQPSVPAGTTPSNANNTGGNAPTSKTFAEAIANAMNH